MRIIVTPLLPDDLQRLSINHPLLFTAWIITLHVAQQVLDSAEPSAAPPACTKFARYPDLPPAHVIAWRAVSSSNGFTVLPIDQFQFLVQLRLFFPQEGNRLAAPPPTSRGSPGVAVGDVGLDDGISGDRLFEEAAEDEGAAARGN
jgi:hypothetical protein